MIKYIVSLTVLLLFGSFSGSLAAGVMFASKHDILESQMQYLDLPEYCQVRLLERDMTNKHLALPPPYSLQSTRWINIIGRRNWTYFHHYCWGIKNTKMALSQSVVGVDSKKNYKYWLKRGAGEFKFMKDRADKSFPFWGNLKTYENFISSSLNGK